MSFLLAVLVVVTFAAAIGWLDLPARAREATARTRDSLEVLRDASLDDRAKEEALQRQSLRLFRLLGVLAGGSVLALGLPLAGVWLLELGGVASLEAVLSVLERPDFLAGTTAVGFGLYLIVRRRPGA